MVSTEPDSNELCSPEDMRYLQKVSVLWLLCPQKIVFRHVGNATAPLFQNETESLKIRTIISYLVVMRKLQLRILTIRIARSDETK